MPGVSTSFLGPLGSTIYHLRANAATVAALAGLDWTSRFRRVCLDPVRGVVVLMVPSHLHERLTGVFDDIVDGAASEMDLASIELRSTRLREKGEPPGTGMEPDCSFYVGERAHAHLEALAESEGAADAFFEENGPDLVVEVETTHADEGKIERYGDMGVRECWQIHGKRGEEMLRADFSALRRGAPPRPAGGIRPPAGHHSLRCLPSRRRRPTGRRHPRTHRGGGSRRPAPPTAEHPAARGTGALRGSAGGRRAGRRGLGRSHPA